MDTKTSKNPEEEQTLKTPSSLFQTTIVQISIAQICQSIGFTRCQTSALQAFSNIATRYLEAVAKVASLSANSSGRTQCNLFDLTIALEDLNAVRGFDGATNLKKPLLKSGVLRDIMKFVRTIDEIPFAKPIPRRNFGTRLNVLNESKRIQGQICKFSHIPRWLPGFPDPSTYKNVDVRVVKEERIGFRQEERDRGVVDRSIDWNVESSAEEMSFLPIKRPKVKFKFGVDSSVGVNVELGTTNGVCRGGKRVAWHNLSEEEDIKSFKRRR